LVMNDVKDNANKMANAHTYTYNLMGIFVSHFGDIMSIGT